MNHLFYSVATILTGATILAAFLLHKKQEIIKDAYYFKYKNPYNIFPQGYCPTQAEGTLPCGNFYYFRVRHNKWSLEIAKTKGHWFKNQRMFQTTGIADDSLTHRDLMLIANKEIKAYYERPVDASKRKNLGNNS